MYATLDEMRDMIVADLTNELKKDEMFDAELLTAKVDNAMREVRAARRYPPFMDDLSVLYDIARYERNVRNLALYDYNQVGMEHEVSHSESGISRTYADRNKMFTGISPLSRVI